MVPRMFGRRMLLLAVIACYDSSRQIHSSDTGDAPVRARVAIDTRMFRSKMLFLCESKDTDRSS